MVTVLQQLLCSTALIAFEFTLLYAIKIPYLVLCTKYLVRLKIY